MMGAFLLFCIFLVVGAGVYQLVTEGTGYLLIVWDKTSIEMDLLFALICLLVIFFVFWILLSFFRGGFRGLASVKHKVFSYSDNKAQAKALDGLIDYIEGNWSSARKKLTRSANKVSAPLINYLAAARSAYELGDEQGALELLHKAETCTEKSGMVVAISQARMQLGSQHYEQALATLERATAINPEHPAVLSLRQQVYIALKDWSALKALLPQLAKNNIGTANDRHRLELMLHREKFTDQIEKYRRSDSEDKRESLDKAWSVVPSHLRREEFFLTTYAEQLMALDNYEKAEKVLSEGLNRYWHQQWLDLYGLLLCSDMKKPLKVAEKWLSQHPQSAPLLLALGRLCMQNQQWGRAKDFLQKSLALEERPETYAELARVMELKGEEKESVTLFKKGLLLSTETLATYPNVSDIVASGSAGR